MIVSITASAWSSLMTSASRTNPPVRIDVSNGGAEGYYKVGGQPQWSPWRKRVSHNHVKGHIRYRNVTIDCPHCISPPNLPPLSSRPSISIAHPQHSETETETESRIRARRDGPPDRSLIIKRKKKKKKKKKKKEKSGCRKLIDYSRELFEELFGRGRCCCDYRNPLQVARAGNSLRCHQLRLYRAVQGLSGSRFAPLRQQNSPSVLPTERFGKRLDSQSRHHKETKE
ncbi:hypothetical protein HDV57DRAFT_237596 [Trichoderma longibrachiatum]